MGSNKSSLQHIPNAQELIQETGFSTAHFLQSSSECKPADINTSQKHHVTTLRKTAGSELSKLSVSAAHIQRLYERFDLLDRDQMGRLRVPDFEAIPELAMNPIGDRIIAAFFSSGKDTVDFPTFVRVLAHFQPTESNRSRESTQEPYNSPNRKLRFAFQLYDQDQDGKISRAELLQVLQEMLGLQVTDEQLQSIVERAIQEADLDQDDAISFDEFKKSLEKVDIDQKMRIGFLS